MDSYCIYAILKIFSKYINTQPSKYSEKCYFTYLARGEMHLRSANFRDTPLFNPKYFEDLDGSDIKVMVEGGSI